MRVHRGIVARKRRKKILKMASGFFGSRHRLFRVAKESVDRALCFAYRDRKVRKRFFRQLWIIRINAFLKYFNKNYSSFMSNLNYNSIIINRKFLAFFASNHPNIFFSIVRCGSLNEK